MTKNLFYHSISLKCFLLNGCFLLFCSLGYGKISTEIFENTIIATTDQRGKSGIKGCKLTHTKPASAFVFELQYQPLKNQQTCGKRSSHNWETIVRKESINGEASFTNLANGQYRVICLAGKTIGCKIDHPTKRSIIYQKESSPIIRIPSEASLVEKEPSALAEEVGLSVFPNPANTEVTIQLIGEDLQGKLTLRLLNLLGQEVYLEAYSLESVSIPFTQTLDVSSYPTGAYFISVEDEYGNQWQKKILIHSSY